MRFAALILALALFAVVIAAPAFAQLQPGESTTVSFVQDGTAIDSVVVTCEASPVGQVCGDATCDAGEDCSTCPGDCGACPSGAMVLPAGSATDPSLRFPGGGIFGLSTGIGFSFLYNGTTWTYSMAMYNCTGNSVCLDAAGPGGPQILLGAGSSTSPNIRPNKADNDTGMGPSAGGGVGLTDEHVPLLAAELGEVRMLRPLVSPSAVQVCADDGTTASAVVAIDASTVQVVYLDTEDPDGCEATVLSVGAHPDSTLEIINRGPYAATIQSTPGAVEAAGAVVLGEWDSLVLRRAPDRWVQTGGSDNSAGLAGTSYADADIPDSTVPGEHFNAFGNVSVYPGGYLAVYRKGGSHIGGEGSIWGATSTDGETWGPEFPIYSEPGYDTRDPEVMQTAAGDLLMTVVLTDPVAMDLVPSGNRVLKADNPGTPSGTWTVYPANSTFTGGEASSAPLVELANGDLLYPVWGRDVGDGLDSSRLLRSTDGGATWTELAVLAEGGYDYQEPVVQLLDDGRLLALVRTGATTYTTYSTDDGATWSAPSPAFSGGGAPRWMQATNGALIVVYRGVTDGSTVVRWSSDRGSTWSAEALIDPDFYHYGGFVERAPNQAMLAFWARTSGTECHGHVTTIDLTGLGPAL